MPIPFDTRQACKHWASAARKPSRSPCNYGTGNKATRARERSPLLHVHFTRTRVHSLFISTLSRIPSRSTDVRPSFLAGKRCQWPAPSVSLYRTLRDALDTYTTPRTRRERIAPRALEMGRRCTFVGEIGKSRGIVICL